jgi:hypothetical protein
MKLLAGLMMICLLSVNVEAQISSFVQEARYHLEDFDSCYALEGRSSTTSEVNVLADSVIAIEELMQYCFLQKYKSNVDTLQQSLVLSHLSQIAARRINGINGAKPEKMQQIKRKLFRVFRSARSSFGLINVYSFDLELVNTPHYFYYDKNGADGGFNLYKGKRKPKATKEDPEPETEALKLLTETELFTQLEDKLRRSGCSRELHSGLVSCIGYAVVPNKKTFFRKKTPTVKVVVITGTRRLRLVKERHKTA